MSGERGGVFLVALHDQPRRVVEVVVVIPSYAAFAVAPPVAAVVAAEAWAHECRGGGTGELLHELSEPELVNATVLVPTVEQLDRWCRGLG